MGLAKHTVVGLLTGLILATVPVLSTASASTTSWSCFNHKKVERNFHRKMNSERSTRSLDAYRLDKQLSLVARKHSVAMAKQDAVFHTSDAKLARKVTRWKTLSENVGRGTDVKRTHFAFMSSSGHRANILHSSFRHVGVGTVTKNGVLYVSVVFEGARDPGTTLSTPSC